MTNNDNANEGLVALIICLGLCAAFLGVCGFVWMVVVPGLGPWIQAHQAGIGDAVKTIVGLSVVFGALVFRAVRRVEGMRR